MLDLSGFNLFFNFLLLLDLHVEVVSGNLRGPIIDIIDFNLTGFSCLSDQILQILVVRSLLELQPFSVVDKCSHLVRKPFAQKLSWCCYLFLHDQLVLGLSIFSLHILPRKYASEHIHHDITD